MTMDADQINIWSLSVGTSSDLTNQVNMISGSDNVKLETTHKDEAPSRIASDVKDKKAERETLLKSTLIEAGIEPVDSVTVVVDTTDILALLPFYYYTLQIGVPTCILMTSPKKLKAVGEGCNSIVDDILSVHALSGCETVSPYYGIGKITAL